MFEMRNVLGRGDYRNFEMAAADALVLGPPQLVESSRLIHEPGWTLFELDFKIGAAVFLDVGDESDIFAQSFAHNAQLAAARRHATLPFDAFLRLSAGLDLPLRLINLFNPGHCGSTLLHHVFNAEGQVCSLSEPQFTYNIALHAGHLAERERASFVQACMKFIPLFPRFKNSGAFVVKHFSQVTRHFDVWNAAMPDAINIYLHRDAVSWCNSVYGFAQRSGMPADMPRDERRFVWTIMTAGVPMDYLDGLADIDGPDVRFEDFAAIAWCIHAQQVRAAQAGGMTFVAFTYRELNDSRLHTIKRIFAACGLAEANEREALMAFERDSHEGEPTSHDKPVQKLDHLANERVLQMLRHPRFSIQPDATL